MMSERRGVQLSMITPSIEEIVPSDDIYRQIEAVVDFNFIYDELRPYYCADNGKYSTDPVVVVKSLLIAFLEEIYSERKLERQLHLNAAYRWFIGLGYDERVPDHSTISQLRRRKFNDADIFKKLFMHVLKLCAEKGLISGRLLITDSTHVKANASKTSKITVETERSATEFFDKLDKYEAEERERLGMPEITRKPPEPKKTEQTMSVSDPEAGWFCRPDKPEGFHYLAHQTIDAENGIIVDVHVTPGNTPDCNPYIEQIDRVVDKLDELNIEVKAVSADSAYDTALIHKELEERELAVFIPKKETSDNSKTEYKRDDYSYNQDTDEFICPSGKTLTLRTLQRTETGVYREYRADTKICKACPNRDKCLAPSQKSRKIQVNIFQQIVDKHHAVNGSAEYNDALRKRQILCEGTFATQKARHNLGQMFRRGLRAAADHCLLSACVVNLKRLVRASAGA
jgi:transposase